MDPNDLQLENLLGNGCFGEIWKAKVTIVVDEKQIVDYVAIKENTGMELINETSQPQE